MFHPFLNTPNIPHFQKFPSHFTHFLIQMFHIFRNFHISHFIHFLAHQVFHIYSREKQHKTFLRISRLSTNMAQALYYIKSSFNSDDNYSTLCRNGIPRFENTRKTMLTLDKGFSLCTQFS